MLGIIGLILKIILFIILGIIGLLMLIIGIILWVPFRYKLIGEKQEVLRVDGSVSWLFGLIRVVFDYQEEVTYQVKVLFFTVVDSKKETIDKKKKTKANNQSENDVKKDKQQMTKSLKEKANDDLKSTVQQRETKEEEIVIERPLSDLEDRAETKAQESPLETKDELIDEKQHQSDGMDSGETIDTKNEKHKEKFKSKPKNNAKSKAKSKAETKETSKFEEIKAAWQQFKQIWQDPAYDGVIRFVFGKLFKMLKSILPQTIRGEIIFGTGDPATTGYIFGGISLFYGITRDKFVVTPDFMEKIFLGRITIKGRVFLGVLVYYGIRIYLDKRVRKLIKVIRKNTETG